MYRLGKHSHESGPDITDILPIEFVDNASMVFLKRFLFTLVTSITSIVKQLILGNPGSVQPYKCLSQGHGPTSLVGPAPLQRCPLSTWLGRYVRFGLSFLTEFSISPAFKPNRILISIPVSRSHGSRMY